MSVLGSCTAKTGQKPCMPSNGLCGRPAAPGGSVLSTRQHGFCTGERCVCGASGALQQDRVVSPGCLKLGKSTHHNTSPTPHTPKLVPGITWNCVTGGSRLAQKSVLDKSPAPDRPPSAFPDGSLAMGAPTSTIVKHGLNGVSGKTAAGKRGVPGKTATLGFLGRRERQENGNYHRLELSWREASEV